jgi:Uncharacterized homolog of the cytoplasmic domain of flagellar protein FhlB
MEDVRKLVAIRYPSDAECPFISLKAKGHLAEKLLDIVAENEIPVVEDAFLSGILTAEEIGASIPIETWEIVAKIFAHIANL